MNDELTPASMEAAARPFYEPCERNLREWVESDYETALVSRLDLKRVMQEYDRRGEELNRVPRVRWNAEVDRLKAVEQAAREVVRHFNTDSEMSRNFGLDDRISNLEDALERGTP